MINEIYGPTLVFTQNIKNATHIFGTPGARAHRSALGTRMVYIVVNSDFNSGE